MISKWVKIVTGAIGVFLVGAFVIGLAHSISIGFAGFWGGLPFSIITATVLAFICYDYWDLCIRKKGDDQQS